VPGLLSHALPGRLDCTDMPSSVKDISVAVNDMAVVALPMLWVPDMRDAVSSSSPSPLPAEDRREEAEERRDTLPSSSECLLPPPALRTLPAVEDARLVADVGRDLAFFLATPNTAHRSAG
jgi:hypothetical protein